MLSSKSKFLFTAVAMACCLLAVTDVQAQGLPEVINFQGVLRNTDGTLIADGTHQLVFVLNLAETGPSPVWTEGQAVTTTDGVFNVRLGANQPLNPIWFQVGLWLEIQILNGMDYEVLSPRVQMTPVPSAMWALNVPDNSIGTPELSLSAVMTDNIAPGAVTDTRLADGAVTNAKLADGAAVETLNTFSGDVSLIGGNNMTITPYGNGLLFEADGGTSGPVVNSLNSKTGDVNLIASTNITIQPSGNNLYISAATSAGGDDGDWAVIGSNLVHDTTGVVALGTGTPDPAVSGQAMLQVEASLYPGLALDATSPSYSRWLMYQDGVSSDLVFGHTTTTGLGSTKLTLNADGQLGIGHTPEVTLDIDGGNYLLSDTNHGDFQIGNNGNALRFGVDVEGTSTGRAKIRAVSASDTPMLSLGVGSYDVVRVLEDHFDFWVRGVKKADFWGGDDNDRGGQLFMYGTGSTATVELDGYNNWGGYVGVRMDSGVASASMSTTSSGGEIVCRDAAGNITVTIDGQYSDGFGRVITEVLEITGGSDLSEQFKVSLADQMTALEPGLVVSIDPANPGELQVCQTAYDRKVAGVISGAGGVRPGMLMGQKGSAADGDHPVALTGRVYVQADATAGAIEPGDLLTTSEVAGHAMKVTDHSRANGAILGKAMTGLTAGQGLVLVLVSLQ